MEPQDICFHSKREVTRFPSPKKASERASSPLRQVAAYRGPFDVPCEEEQYGRSEAPLRHRAPVRTSVCVVATNGGDATPSSQHGIAVRATAPGAHAAAERFAQVALPSKSLAPQHLPAGVSTPTVIDPYAMEPALPPAPAGAPMPVAAPAPVAATAPTQAAYAAAAATHAVAAPTVLQLAELSRPPVEAQLQSFRPMDILCFRQHLVWWAASNGQPVYSFNDPWLFPHVVRFLPFDQPLLTAAFLRLHREAREQSATSGANPMELLWQKVGEDSGVWAPEDIAAVKQIQPQPPYESLLSYFERFERLMQLPALDKYIMWNEMTGPFLHGIREPAPDFMPDFHLKVATRCFELGGTAAQTAEEMLAAMREACKELSPAQQWCARVFRPKPEPAPAPLEQELPHSACAPPSMPAEPASQEQSSFTPAASGGSDRTFSDSAIEQPYKPRRWRGKRGRRKSGSRRCTPGGCLDGVAPHLRLQRGLSPPVPQPRPQFLPEFHWRFSSPFQPAFQPPLQPQFGPPPPMRAGGPLSKVPKGFKLQPPTEPGGKRLKGH